MRSNLVSAFVFTLCLSSAAIAGDCCAHCGCQTSCNKVCRLVPVVKRVTEPVYDCDCYEFCVPGKSDCCVGCDECGRRKLIYTPTCGCVRTGVRLVKKMETKEIKTYRCELVDLCSHCAEKCGASPDNAPAEKAPMPPAPMRSAGVDHGPSESWAVRALQRLPLAAKKQPTTDAAQSATAAQTNTPAAPSDATQTVNPIARVLKPLVDRK